MTQRAEVINSPAYVSLAKTDSGIYRTFEGTVVPRSYTLTAGNLIPPASPAALDALGTTGISRSIPTNPLSGMGQFLGEVRQLPKAPDFHRWRKTAGDFKQMARKGADDYLNVEFGWAPFVSEISDFLGVVISAEKHINQFERDSGRNIRRRRVVYQDESTSVTPLGNSYGVPSVSTQIYSKPGVLTASTTTSRKVWFSGAFTYYLPPSGLKRKAALANKLYGLRVTPSLLWELAPWSWAADWVSNIGDVVNNWSAFQNDGLVMRWGYVMETIAEVTTYSLTGAAMKGHGGIDCSQTVRRITKSRAIATPYGFGLSPEAFSPRQWAILAALGINLGSRLR